LRSFTYTVAQKVSRYQIIKNRTKSYRKSVTEVRLVRQIKISIKHCNIIRWY